MRARLLAAAGLLMLLGAAPASAATYTYEGGLYTGNSSPFAFGERITASVTTPFDTSFFTGILNNIDWSVAAGPISFTYTQNQYGPGLVSSFGFTDGDLSHWNISILVGCGAGIGTCSLETVGLEDGRSGDRIYTVCHSCIHQSAIGPGGIWTAVPVPGPAVGTGLPALMMLLAWWLKSRRQ